VVDVSQQADGSASAASAAGFGAAPPHQTLVGTAPRRTRAQRASAAVITADARCTPVLVRAAIIGRARMPRAALEISRPHGEVLGWVALSNTSASFDLRHRWWLVGDPAPGAVVALVSEDASSVLLAGSRLHRGPVVEPPWSPLACRLLGWERPMLPDDASASLAAIYSSERHSADGPGFTEAVRQFRVAAVFVPLVFFAICFPYLFVIPPLLASGASAPAMLALPVLGGGLMTAWSWQCRRQVAIEADAIEAGAARYGREIAFTQSYWTGMRKPAAVWDGPLPAAITA
jgi:hypothetical protein